MTDLPHVVAGQAASDMTGVATSVLRLMAERRAAYGAPITEIELTRAELEEVKRTYGYVLEDGPLTVAFGVPVKLVDEAQED